MTPEDFLYKKGISSDTTIGTEGDFSLVELLSEYADQALLKFATEWISVKDKSKLPQREIDVLFSNSKDEWVSIGFLGKDNRWYDTQEDSCECEPTHWMPKPKPPKE